MIEILWANGQLTKACTWPELERQVRVAQWGPYKTRQEFRRAMAARACMWTGIRPTIGGSSERFLKKLAAAGLFMVVSTVKDES